MPTPAERRALLYLALVAGTGTVVRLWEARAEVPSSGSPHALARQLAAVDSVLARRASSAPRRAPSTVRSVPGRGRPAVSASASTERASVGASVGAVVGPIDVDRVDAAALEALPGIGPALAARIVDDRARRGPFGSSDGLERVRGIGPALARRLAGRVTFSGTPRPSDGGGRAAGAPRAP